MRTLWRLEEMWQWGPEPLCFFHEGVLASRSYKGMVLDRGCITQSPTSLMEQPPLRLEANLA